MGKNIVQKIIGAHLVSGQVSAPAAGQQAALRVDQVYTQDATGTMAWLQFEAIGVPGVRVPLAVSYVDHNMLQSNFMNADDHEFLRTAAAKFGAWFSRPGNGISHQVHLERFSAPGKVALGTDSHTPTGGGIGMLAIGVGGLDAATVMAGAPFELVMPEVVLVRLTGALRRPWVAAMDVILELLRRLSVKGGVGRIIEYGGTGVAGLSVPERATITNMGAELGATSSIFPSDGRTKFFLKAQDREKDWMELEADAGAEYAQVIEIDLSLLEPLVAMPHSPDNVKPARELEGQKTAISQACIGSCTNSSYMALTEVASALRGRVPAPGVSVLLNPGSKQVYEMLSRQGVISDLVASGVRVLESSCGPCIGMGGAPGSAQSSVRSYNRNFKGRSGTKDAFVYLANPLLCAYFALKGRMADPLREHDIKVEVAAEPEKYLINDNMLVPPPARKPEIVKGPNIKEVPLKGPADETIEAEVLLVLGDNITTDDIMPAGSAILPLRSNVPAISEHVFSGVDPGFSRRAGQAKARGGGIIIGGENYGQGSSREHAALAPMFLGVKAVIAKSFARIHRANLINFGVLPLVFKNGADSARIKQSDRLRIKVLRAAIEGDQSYLIEDVTQGFSFEAASNLSPREAALVLEGGLLPYTRKRAAERKTS